MISLTYFFQFNRDIDHIYHSKINFQVLLYLCHNDLAFFINNLIRNHKMYYTEFPTTTPSTSKRPLSSVPIADSAFIQVLSNALKLSFHHFCYTETLKANEKAIRKNREFIKQKNSMAELIQISDDQSQEKAEGNKQKLCKEFNLRINHISQYSDEGEGNLRKDLQKTLQIGLECERQRKQISNNVNSNDKIKQEMEIDEQQSQFIQFQAVCPSLGIKNSQLELKRNNLLQRQVTTWEQLSSKRKGQKRQIKMLQR